MARPVLYVLAGVNGAGKSSIGGYLLERTGLAWFNPDTFARELRSLTACDQQTANAHAWAEGMRRLDEALSKGRSFAFETTLGGHTVAAKLRDATRTHDLLLWFCGLASVEQHIARVAARVAAGGHPIPEEKIRERHPQALLNLIDLMAQAAHVVVYDNSTEAGADSVIPDPLLVMELEQGKLLHPDSTDLKALRAVPDWAKPVLEAALRNAAKKPSARLRAVRSAKTSRE